ncbi:cholinesterase-like [Oppia nitens]|uniref:cholinesterase-like n=1 Tax=Oppia nitens TaxID=1686743 RepID=UPI0023DBA8F8|nr:cholinesterase-like [Oppia nitens]
MLLKITFVLYVLVNILQIYYCTELTVNTTSGVVKGLDIHVLNTSIAQYLNIPYAEPPVGRLRFSKPEPLKHPKQLIDGSKTGNSCVQTVMDSIKHFMGNITQNEDCLVLNVWTPNDNEKSNVLKPVMFWIHGGGLKLGSSFQWVYNGSALAAYDVVVVSVNYRLDVFGFIYDEQESSAQGNVGLFDQLLALKWVRENIHNFGGNKDKITIFGESSGSWSVSAHILSPLSKGLFKRAIMQSGATFYNKLRQPLNTTEALQQSIQLGKQFNCTTSQWLDCLRKVDARELIKYKSSFLVYPLIDNKFLVMNAQKAFQTKYFNKDIDIIAGITRHEGVGILYPGGQVPHNMTKKDFIIFMDNFDLTFHNLNVSDITGFYVSNKTSSHDIQWALYDALGDLTLSCPTYLFAKSYTQYTDADSNNNNVYFYELTYQRLANSMGLPKETDVTHGADLDFVFGLPVLKPEKSDTELDVEFSRHVMKIWTDFAKYGKPSTVWPKLVDNRDPKYVHKIYDLNPNTDTHIFNNLFSKTCLVKGIDIHVLNTSIAQYLNIPYAEPPLGRLRFSKPEPLKRPKQLIDGTKSGNSCIQSKSDLLNHFLGNLTQNEDCLVLNVWTPNNFNKSNVLKPVMFWIHGGGLAIGSSFQWEYNASALASHDVVVVSINYRLNILGFLYGDQQSSPGNLGLYDQLLALKWVRENIHEFGGDKNNITIFGESAGSLSVSTHLLSPLSKGLFKRAIMESAAMMVNKQRVPASKSEALAVSLFLAKEFNCSLDRQLWLDCLRKVEAQKFMKYSGFSLILPLLETEFLPMSAQQAFDTKNFNKDVDLLAGVAPHEGSALLNAGKELPHNQTAINFQGLLLSMNSTFHLNDFKKITDFYLANKTKSHDIEWAMYDLYGDLLITCPTYLFAKNYSLLSSSTGSNNVYFYEITYQRETNALGAVKQLNVTHGADVDFVFGLPVLKPEKTDTQVDVQFSKRVMKLWTDFAKYGLIY